MTSLERGAPAFLWLAAHPLRWRLLTELAASDRRVRELVELCDQPQNLVSYHLRLLRGAGLVRSHRSSFDARDSYYHLDLDGCSVALGAVGAALHPALTRALETPSATSLQWPARTRVLFTCTGNSARSPIAEALLRHHVGTRVDVVSAGSHPKARIHASAVRVLREQYGGLDISDQRPRHLESVSDRRFDYVISLCDKVREVIPEFSAQPRLVHWSIPDPAADGTDRPGSSDFRRTAAEIDTRVRYLIPVLSHTTKQEVQS